MTLVKETRLSGNNPVPPSEPRKLLVDIIDPGRGYDTIVELVIVDTFGNNVLAVKVRHADLLKAVST
jgi:hypothetical protein